LPDPFIDQSGDLDDFPPAASGCEISFHYQATQFVAQLGPQPWAYNDMQ
jgi:hypothetical protein